MVDIASQVVSRIGDNAQHPISFIQEKVAEVATIGCAIADLTIGQAFRTPEQQVQRIQEFAATIDSYAGLPWAEKKTIFVNAVADIITVTGFATAGKMVTSLAANIPQYLPAITAAFSEGTSELLGALSETLYGASFSGGGAAAAQTAASQEVIADSIAQVASGFATAIAADGSATLSMPDPPSVLRQDSEKTTGGSAPDVVKSQPTKTVDEIKISEKDVGHIFRNKKGHFPQDTPENRKSLLDLTSSTSNFLGKCSRYGNEWYGKILPNGKQLWAVVRNGAIRHGGLNDIPCKFHPESGLSRPFLPKK